MCLNLQARSVAGRKAGRISDASLDVAIAASFKRGCGT
jgi:hypothetical protein